eukprot:6210909-Pleurochrysis_carterae.AAC.4
MALCSSRSTLSGGPCSWIATAMAHAPSAPSSQPSRRRARRRHLPLASAAATCAPPSAPSLT